MSKFKEVNINPNYPILEKNILNTWELNKTPQIRKNDRTFDDVEMRRTKMKKPPLMSSKLPPAFGFNRRYFK